VKNIILIFLLALAGFSVSAQSTGSKPSGKSDRKAEKKQKLNALSKQQEEGTLSFAKQNAFGLQLRTNGYGLFYELGKRRSPRFTNLYMLEWTEIKHRKEDKRSGNESFFSNSYIYGKQNNFYQTKLGFGQQYILGQKGNKNGVAVTASVVGGLSLGMLKPYYMIVADSVNKERTIRYNEDSVRFLDLAAIIGGAGFTKGWNSLKIEPGVFLKTALRFDFGRYNEKLQALEIGMSIEYYMNEIPILVYSDPKHLFFQGHIAFVFGGRK